MPSGQALLDLLDLPKNYSRLVGNNLREPSANEKGKLSILAPTTLAIRGDLIELIERQLSRPGEHDLNAANAYVNVAIMSRAAEAKRRGVAAYSAGLMPKKGIETIFHCECLGKNGQHFVTFHNIYKMFTSHLKMRNFMLYF
jgi:hypothetical protein